MKRYLLSASLVGIMALAGCQGNDVLSLKANAPIPADALPFMKANGMTKASPVMMRIFKEEAVLEVWKKKDTGRYAMVKSYEICKYSGDKGPKFKEGDRQAPEGFYFVGRPQMNPNSSYHLSFNLGFPNPYDRSHGRTGSHLMVHGDCSSAGCYAMTDEGVSEIYAFAREALNGGLQTQFQVQAFPFRMTPENMASHRNDEHFEYWKMLKEGYDHFELTKQPPKVDVCEKRYVFNQQAEDGEFSPADVCPAMSMPPRLELAYVQLQNEHAQAFEDAVAKLEGRAPNKVPFKPLPQIVVAPEVVEPTVTPPETDVVQPAVTQPAVTQPETAQPAAIEPPVNATAPGEFPPPPVTIAPVPALIPTATAPAPVTAPVAATTPPIIQQRPNAAVLSQ